MNGLCRVPDNQGLASPLQTRFYRGDHSLPVKPLQNDLFRSYPCKDSILMQIAASTKYIRSCNLTLNMLVHERGIFADWKTGG